MSETPIGGMSVDVLVTRLASDAITPGSGAAGALALALAAACASKAIAITAKHRALSAPVVQAARSLTQLQRFALHGADEDAEHFKEFLRHQDAAAAAELRQIDHDLFALCEVLNELIDRISGEIHPIVTGDITAARALVAAAAEIHRRNSEAT